MVDEKGSILSYPNNLSLGITIAAAFFSFLYIGQKSMWLDEAYSIFFTKLPWGDLWTVIWNFEANQGLYYVFLKLWLVLGDSEFAVRALSALFSIASIPVLYAFAKRLFGIRAGLIVVLLLSVNGFFIQYAQEARGYSLVFFLVVLSSYMFVRYIEDSSNRKILCGYVIISALAVYAHFFGALVLIAHTLTIPFLPSNKIRTRKALIANLLIIALIIPIGLFILFKDHGQISWISKPSVSQIIELFKELTGDVGHNGYITSFYLLTCVITLTHALVTLFKTGRSMDTWRFTLIFFWLAVPIGFSYGFSYFKPIFINRFLFVALPGLILLSGIGIALINDKYCHYILLVFVIVLSVRAMFIEYYPKGKENYRESTSYIASHAQRGDGIIFYTGFTIIPFEYYWRRLNTPPDLLESVYPSKFGRYNFLDESIRDSPGPPIYFLESLKVNYMRIWVILRDRSPDNIERKIILSTFGENYQMQKEKNYKGVCILLFVKK